MGVTHGLEAAMRGSAFAARAKPSVTDAFTCVTQPGFEIFSIN
jgi:hypothetical protein